MSLRSAKALPITVMILLICALFFAKRSTNVRWNQPNRGLHWNPHPSKLDASPKGTAVNRSSPGLIDLALLARQNGSNGRRQWPNIPQCDNYRVSFLHTSSVRRMPLASFPGSGNTWTRYLLESLTGIFTGDIYATSKGHARPMGFPGSKVPVKASMRRTFIYKTHKPEFARRSCGKAILIIRNPLLASFAEYNREVTGSGKGIAKTVRSSKHMMFTQKSMAKWHWQHLYMSYVNKARKCSEATNTTIKSHLFPLIYESMVDDLGKEMSDLIDFLNIKVDAQRLKCVLDNPSGKFHRKARSEQVRFPFQLKHANALRNQACNVHNKLVKLGFPGLPLERYRKDLLKVFADPGDRIPKFKCSN